MSVEIQWCVLSNDYYPHYIFEGVSGAIDGTCHFRNRIHPRSGDLYRGDKHAHFVGAQVVCGLDGKYFRVILTLGHNNDSGALKLT